MDGDDVLQAIWDANENHYHSGTRERQREKMLKKMADLLTEQGWYGFEDTDTLRDKALSDTDLVEPNAE